MEDDKTRIQFDLGKKSLERFDEAVKLSNAETRAEAMRLAVSLYTSLVFEMQKPGTKLILRDKDGKETYVMPVL